MRTVHRWSRLPARRARPRLGRMEEGNGRHWDVQHGFDREAALERLREHPEVMPPNPLPYRASKREAFGVRVPQLFWIALAGVTLPVLVSFALRR